MGKFLQINPHKILHTFHTPFGERSVYDSAAHCTRCGSCQQTCPSYAFKKQETFSPRGRNQVFRLLLEGKLDIQANRMLLEEVIQSCTLCGRCTQACAGKIPTAEHMLELRRRLQTQMLPGTLFTLLSLRHKSPVWFGRMVRTGLLLRRAGLIKILHTFKLTNIFGLGWINRADELLPKKTVKLSRLLARRGLDIPQKPSLIYLPSLEAEFFLPELAADVLQTVSAKHRPGIWFNTSSGLFEYIYGDLRKSRLAVRRLIHRRAAEGCLPLLTDSIDIFNFLKRAPQLFSGNKRWEEKAREFADAVVFITDFLPVKPPKNASRKPAVRLDYSSLFTREGEAFSRAEKILKTHFKKNFVECLYTDADTPAFGYGFVRNALAQDAGLRAVQSIAQTQSSTVFTLSGLAALELNCLLKRFYPAAKAQHIVNLHG